ncbi:hypothetical protein Pmar_PMAR025585 [Perkinsus marinus ATCC 50983]|uniref:Uncharacterized protein n=1 Tax=Perkinsus marinus (strain ATCC 50983 / TXsc) TaxID=423536 RepID=C5LZG4_PERM5|nr:hypothetical protein Pmar_PMAR025585 [Perkinsus marinus ATCC 50983]EEQ97958.1 hypothetical protein Pmar_PMAR025585 [Perkinsus marinus ATCC 50983]|eukprot:XP_002765241.1 hypothetical protein Pmar_PMAR025585 [Perkinsus marinus ATCC 50983]
MAMMVTSPHFNITIINNNTGSVVKIKMYNIKIIDNTPLQLQTILDEDAFREAQYEVYELSRDIAGGRPIPDNMVKCSCGEIYCSEECRLDAYKKHHWALCVANEANNNADNSSITKFKYHCLSIDGCGDTLLLAAQVLAQLVSSCEDNEKVLHKEVEDLMTYCHGEITKIARPPPDMDDDAYNNSAR